VQIQKLSCLFNYKSTQKYILRKRKPNKSPVFQQQNLSEIELQNQDKFRQTALFKKNPAFSAGGYRIRTRPTISWNSED
jgi:hypothetical protein